jgi:hypothetical protein
MPSLTRRDNFMGSTPHAIKVECRRCNKAWLVELFLEELEALKREAWTVLFDRGADITQQILMGQVLAGLVPLHDCKLPYRKPKDVVGLIAEALEEADARGERFTQRGFCRYAQGLGGLGRVRLRRVVEQALVDGRLTLEDGENENGVKVRWLRALAL